MIENRLSVIAPNFADSFRDLDDLVYEFGPHKGRFIFPAMQTWLDCLYDEMATHPSVSQIEMEKLKEAKRVIEGKGYLVQPWDLSLASEWGVALEQCRVSNRPFEFIVGPRDAENTVDSITWDQCFPEIRRVSKTQWTIKGSVTEYMEAMRPLLLSARTVILVDRFFDPLASPYGGLDLLKAVFAELRRAGRCKKLHVISEVREKEDLTPQFFEDLEIELREVYQSLLPACLSFEWHIIWDTNKRARKDQRFFEAHDRCFLTNHGGLSFGKGFGLREVNVDDRYDVFYMTKEMFEEKSKRFQMVVQKSGSTGRVGSRSIHHLSVSN